jgi:Fic-DOC domain mobile mystery protein B
MVNNFFFKDRDGQTPLPVELRKGLIPKTVQSMGELDEYEEENIASGLSWLEKYSGEDYITSTFWLKLHKKLFNKTWKWAGRPRTHELDNPIFLQPYQIWPEFKKLEDDLKYWIKNKTYPEIELAARFHERIETIHPFPNGNGRFGRILIEYFCKRQGISVPSWGTFLKDKPQLRRSTYIDALNQARQTRKYDSLINIMYS